MMLDSVLQFFGGFVFAIILARTPLIVLPRLTALQNNLAPFPNPQPVDEQLLSQMLVLRTIWNLSFLFALLPLAFGYLILSTFAAPIAFGLFIGGGWSILSRLMPSDGLSIPNTPYPYE
ncbi:MAG: hypothetical protein HOF90_02755, partial [Euryarchaeota archaeon]|nr:hypothetical protein [Euryarchaeota archaeon]